MCLRLIVIDLVRLIAAYAPGLVASSESGDLLVTTLLSASSWTESWPTPLPKPLETNILLALRAFANVFQPSAVGSMRGWTESVRVIPFCSLPRLFNPGIGSSSQACSDRR